MTVQIHVAASAENKTQAKALGSMLKAAAKAASGGKATVTILAQSEQEMLVDELITLDLQLKSIDTASLEKRISEIKKELQSIAQEQPHDQPVTFTGMMGEVVFSACSKLTKVQLPDAPTLLKSLVKKFGVDAAYDAITFNLTKLKKLLSENELAEWTTIEEGSRVSKIKPKPVSE